MKKKFAILSCFIFLACGNPMETVPTLEPGDNAPAFNLKNIDGKMISPEDFSKAKGFILVFISNTCFMAIAYEDRIIELDKKFAPKGYPVIAINSNPPTLSPRNTYKKMQKKAKTKGFNFPYLFDENQNVTNQFGVRVIPYTFLLEKIDFTLKVRYTGAIDNDPQNIKPEKTSYVEDAIAAIEAGEEIEVTSTKAIGCTINGQIIDITS